MESDKIINFPLNLDAMLRECVPGGSSCDPQKVSDAIREWVNAAETGNSRSTPPWIDVRVAEELRKRLQPGEKVIWRDAFRWKDDAGALSNHYEQASVASLVAEFGYTVILDAGCAAIIRDPRATQCPAPAPCGESVAELNRALGKAFPDDQVSAIKAQGAVLPLVNRLAERLALMDKHAAIDNEVILMLIDTGHITPEISTKAANIAHGFEDGPLNPSPKRTEALALRKLVEKGYVTEAMVNEAMNLASEERDIPVKSAAAANPISFGARPVTIKTAEIDEFADIREFRRRAAEMDRQDAERAVAEHDEFLRAQFPREAAARDRARAAVTQVAEVPHISGGLQPFPFDGVPRDGAIPVYAGDPEFDTLPIGEGSIPEAPVPNGEPATDNAQPYKQGAPGSVEWKLRQECPAFDELFRPAWKRDDEKTMLRILLLSAETTGFHGNVPAAHMARIAKWTDAECRTVDEWCLAVHYQASDNEVQVPPKPDVISAPLGERARQPDDIKLTHERYMSRLIAADKHSHAAAARGIAAMISK